MASDSENKGPSPEIAFPLLLLTVLALQILSRQLAAPATGFVLDDWTNLWLFREHDSLGEGIRIALTHPQRPLSRLAMTCYFNLGGMNPMFYGILSMIGHSVFLGFGLALVRDLTGSLRVAALFGIIMAVLPNLTETHNWATMTISAGACALPVYTASAWCWVRFNRHGGLRWFLASLLLYTTALFTYEIGSMILLAYLVLLDPKRLDRLCMLMAPFGIAVMAYAAWRATNAFGLNTYYNIAQQFKVGISVESILWNVRETLSWWAGPRMFGAIRNGWQGMDLAGSSLTLFIVLNLFAGVVAWMLFVRTRPHRAAWKPYVFALAWIAGGVGPTLVAYTAGRLNVIPAVGVSLFAALVLARLPHRALLPLCALVAAGLFVNQGTARQWQLAGRINNRLYAHLVEHQEEWRIRRVLLFDTRTLAAWPRVTDTRMPGDGHAVAYLGNAGLLRAFGPYGMMRLVDPDRAHPPECILDVENDLHYGPTFIEFGKRHDPGSPRRTIPLREVYVVDCFDVGVAESER